MSRCRKLGVIAGGGTLPARIVEAAQARGQDFCVLRLEGFADPALRRFPGEDVAIGQANKVLQTLKAYQCDAAVIAGVVQRPDFTKLKVDWRGALLLPKFLAAARSGDGALLKLIVQEIEKEGVRVIGAEEAMEGLAAPAGALGRCAPGKADLADLRKAAALIHALGPFDVAQAAVVARGLVLAVEAAEGTDAMLARCAGLPDAIKGGVLVKRPKPGQERRIDLPVIGPETIERAKKAGLSGVGVEAGGALVIDRDETVRRADAGDLFVYGFTARDLEAK
jgi:hypothetical protein